MNVLMDGQTALVRNVIDAFQERLDKYKAEAEAGEIPMIKSQRYC